MGIITSQAKYVGAEVRSLAYRYHCRERYLRGAQPAEFRQRRTVFQGKSFVVPQDLYRKMGINERFHDGQFKVTVLTEEEYQKFDRANGRRSGGCYLDAPAPAAYRVGQDVGWLGQRSENSKQTVLPENAPLSALLHETLHDIFDRKLTAEEQDRFIRAGARAFHATMNSGKLNFLRHMPEGIFLCGVTAHAKIGKEAVTTEEELDGLKAERPTRKLYDSLDERNRSFFTELFSMAGEIYFGYSHPLFHGQIPKEIAEFFDSVGIRTSTCAVCSIFLRCG